jgi:hypothetical protein
VTDWVQVAVILTAAAVLAAAVVVDMLRIQRRSRRYQQSVRRYVERFPEDVAWATCRENDYRLAIRISLTRAELATCDQVVGALERGRPNLEVVA